ncbi:hypothetical protein PpBr36_01681 [Pyricularia pennisetigena]|uniref:hypothetical protein n=1 Tax=Pyricularia pennisetigena TaxID=1578925 RepID=UPI001152B369|nr:hypothetical protein PpBr36_01681 [Pyricularia pennisetigena]TLS28172.1 hypothetical protein PpBr36_01681 [Pyricularia pennisetigena]
MPGFIPARPSKRKIALVVAAVFGYHALHRYQLPIQGLPGSNTWQHQPEPLGVQQLNMTERECRTRFPGLAQSIDDIVAQGPFEVSDTGDAGPLQGRIKDGKLYIINAQRRLDLSAEMLNSRTGSLHQLHRAIVTSPEPIPETVFSLNFQDSPLSSGPSMGYSRPADPRLRGDDMNQNRRTFLMPHFSFWAWPIPHVPGGTFDEAGYQEEDAGGGGGGCDWTKKTASAVWRGTVRFESALQPGLRRNLVQVAARAAAAGESWADVLPLNDSTALAIQDFCRYRYVLHTEGVAYSGRFHFLQMCRSVVLSPPLLWMQHTSHLLRPVFSASLLGRPQPAGASGARASRSWPVSYAADEANIVFVAQDWSDLPETVAWLEAHPRAAEGIASRQRELFVGGGYFSPAAEACYWRSLIRGWSAVANVDPDVWGARLGTRFEVFSLKGEL